MAKRDWQREMAKRDGKGRWQREIGEVRWQRSMAKRAMASRRGACKPSRSAARALPSSRCTLHPHAARARTRGEALDLRAHIHAPARTSSCLTTVCGTDVVASLGWSPPSDGHHPQMVTTLGHHPQMVTTLSPELASPYPHLRPHARAQLSVQLSVRLPHTRIQRQDPLRQPRPYLAAAPLSGSRALIWQPRPCLAAAPLSGSRALVWYLEDPNQATAPSSGNQTPHSIPGCRPRPARGSASSSAERPEPSP